MALTTATKQVFKGGQTWGQTLHCPRATNLYVSFCGRNELAMIEPQKLGQFETPNQNPQNPMPLFWDVHNQLDQMMDKLDSMYFLEILHFWKMHFGLEGHVMRHLC